MSVVLIAWGLILFGVAALADILIELFDARMSINLGVLGILWGRGLLKCREGCRKTTVVVTYVLAVLLVVFVPIALAWQFSTDSIPDDILHKLATVVVTLAVLGWMYWVLRRQDVRELFGRPRDAIENQSNAAGNSGRFRFRLGTMFGAVAIIAVLTAKFTEDRSLFVDWSQSHTRTFGRGRGVDVHCDLAVPRFWRGQTRLDRVVFDHHEGDPRFSTSWGSSSMYRHPIILHDGTQIDSSRRGQLFEYRNGKLTTSDRKVDWPQVEAYLNSHADCSLDGLLRYVDKQP